MEDRPRRENYFYSTGLFCFAWKGNNFHKINKIPGTNLIRNTTCGTISSLFNHVCLFTLQGIQKYAKKIGMMKGDG